jgi:hypothetical protein
VGVLDVLGSDHQELVSYVGDLQRGLARRLELPPNVAGLQEVGFTPRHVEAVYSADTPPGGIFGAGVVDLHDRLRPAVFVIMELMTAPVEMMPSAPGAVLTSAGGAVLTPAQRLVETYRDQDSGALWGDLTLVGLPRIRNYGPVAAGAGIAIGSETCTLGTPVGPIGGLRGYLTAGHGARTINGPVLAGGVAIGTVAYSSYREQAQSGHAVPDVAVITLDTQSVEGPSGAPPITGVGLTAPNTLVSAFIHGQLRQARVWALAPELFPDSYAGWGEAILCSPISAPGDSGSPVRRDDNTSICVGHIVGGAEGYLTVVQHLQYQLDAARVALRI